MTGPASKTCDAHESPVRTVCRLFEDRGRNQADGGDALHDRGYSPDDIQKTTVGPLAHRTGHRCRDASRHGDQLPGDQRDHSPRSEFVINGIIAVPLVFLVMIVCLRRSGLREVDPTGTYLT